MTLGHRANVIGIAGSALVATCWLVVYLAPHITRPAWVPRIWLVVLFFLIPLAVVAGFVAAARSRWWHCVTAAAFLSAAVLLVAAS